MPRLCLVLLALLGAACGSSPTPPAEGGPASDAGLDAAPDAGPPPPLGCLPESTWQIPTPKPSLAVTPRLLWRKRIWTAYGPTSFLVRSGNQLAFTMRQLFVVDLEGNDLWQTKFPSFHVGVGSVSADTKGNYYLFADKLYSYDPTGRQRYAIDYQDRSIGGDAYSFAPIIRGSEDLFFRSSDGRVRRVNAQTGATIWERPASQGSAGLQAGGGCSRTAMATHGPPRAFRRPFT